MGKWSDRPRDERGGIIGAGIGMAVAAVIVLATAVESTMIVRYLIMASGLVIGFVVGKMAASPR